MYYPQPRPLITGRVRPFLLWLTTLLITTLLLTTLPYTVPMPLLAPAPITPVVAPDSGRLPLAFVPNAGQTHPAVQFQVQALGGMIFFTPTTVVLSLPPSVSPAAGADAASSLTRTDRQAARVAAPASDPTIVELAFVGAHAAPTITGSDPLPGMVNYLLGTEPAQWHTNLPTYASVVYAGLYDGIDLYYEGQAGRLKSTYTIAPGSDPSRIRWRYTGVDHVQVDANTGDLLLTLPTQATLTEQAPVAWQTIHGRHVPVAVSYTLAADGHIGFMLGDYDPTHPLVIDPTLDYSTYFGGDGWTIGESIAVDATGHAYITGWTSSSDFPTVNAWQGTAGGVWDTFVTKLSADGRTLIYSTYLGGSDADYGKSIAVDRMGNAYVTGETISMNFPTVNAWQDTSGGTTDAFVAKLSADGNTLVYSTYLGGSDGDYSRGIAVDDAGNAHVIGNTESRNFPTARPLQGTNSGFSDAFVAKLSADGRTLVYSTYLGGSNWDNGHSIAVDGTGNAYVTGNTDSLNFPTSQPLQSTSGGNSDAFVAKLNADGSALVYSTYLGGSDEEIGYDLAVNSAGNAYVTGWTMSTNFPTAVNALQSTSGGRGDAFVVKLSVDGSALDYSTYLGGSKDDVTLGIAVDSTDHVYVTGQTLSTDFPTANPFQETYGGGPSDAFVAKLNPDGSALVYSTYLGGSDWDDGMGIALDKTGNAYVTGWTWSTNFPTTVNPWQSTLRGFSDAFVAKISDAPPTYTIRGRITSNGTGLAGVTITDGTRTAMTDASGNYTLQGVPAGNYTLTPARSGHTFTPATRSLTVSEDMTGQDFAAIAIPTATAIPRTYTIRGRVTSNGTGLAGVTITDGTRTATTDSRGNYNLRGVPAGSYMLTPARSGYTFTPTTRNVTVSRNVSQQNFTAASVPTVPATTTPTATTTLTATATVDAPSLPSATTTTTVLPNTYSIRGRVLDGVGNGVAGVTVSDGTRTATTDADGYYTLRDVPTGTYALTVTHEGYTFIPPTRSVTVNGDGPGPDFTAMAADNAPVLETVYLPLIVR